MVTTNIFFFCYWECLLGAQVVKLLMSKLVEALYTGICRCGWWSCRRCSKALTTILRPPHGPHCPRDCDGGGRPFPSDDVYVHGDVVSGRAVHLGGGGWGATVLRWQ